MVRALLEGRKTMTRRLAEKKSWNAVSKPSRRWQAVKPGDRLWVRESFCAGRPALASGAGIIPMKGGIPPGRKIVYREDWDGPDEPPWRPPFSLPRWASRLTLTVTATKIERLQEITREDEIAEGTPDGMFFDALWASIHGDGSWAANPEIVALTFAVEKCNIDQPGEKQ